MTSHTQLGPTIREMLGGVMYINAQPVEHASTIIGVDLSLKGLGLLALPLTWQKAGEDSKDWFGATRGKLISWRLPNSATENQRVTRLARLVDASLSFIFGHEYIAEVVFEQYAFSRQMGHMGLIAEIGGALKYQLRKRGVRVESVTSNTARKLFLGANPKKDPKLYVQAALEKMGAHFHEHPDVCDAFVVANWAASSRGAAVSLPSPQVPLALLGTPAKPPVAARVPRGKRARK